MQLMRVPVLQALAKLFEGIFVGEIGRCSSFGQFYFVAYKDHIYEYFVDAH